MPRDVQMMRIRQVIEEELTPCQRDVLLAYYIEDLTMDQIARDRGIHKSTVCRTLHRAEDKLRRFLRY